ncbi:unnamed protein product, partial [Timema podura]|nr:unnamed protein product [Timema podura]
MDRLLSSRSPPFVYISLSHKHNKNFKEVSSYDETIHFLPSSLDALEGVGKDFLSKAKSPLVVTPSLSPGIGLVPEVPPIFIVPGIQDQIEKVLKPLNRNLMYPTVWIKLPDCKLSLHESAVNIVKHMRSLQPVGPYNIVGVLWGGILSLEIARVLKSQDQKTKIFLLDGAPETSQSLVRLLGTGDELQCNLITKLLDIESNKVQEEIIQLPDWKSRVDYGLSALKNISPKKKHYIASGLEASYKRIGQLLNYKPNETLLYEEVHLVRTQGAPEDDNCNLHKYRKRLARTLSSRPRDTTCENKRNQGKKIW